MSWIKIRTNLATDPAVAAIGISTKMHPRQVVGCLVAVWCWADPLTADGFIPHATEKLIDDISGKRGFSAAMVGVQWLCVESGGIRFPNWDRHHSQSAKARAGESERKRISREHATKSAPPVEKMSGQTSGHITEQSPDQRRGEEIREESKTVGRTDESVPAPGKAAKPATQSDAEWLTSLAGDATYSHVNIPTEHAKMVRWCEVNRKQPSRRRFVNWINRIERPMGPLFTNPVRVQT